MIDNIDIQSRKFIWIAISEFYLDTELLDYDYQFIAKTVTKSHYSLAEIKEINKSEIFPVLKYNFMSVSGEWSGFNQDWLIKNIIDSINNRNKFKSLINRFYYYRFKWMFEDSWRKLEEVMNQNKKVSVTNQ